ncbi:GNAT family N-acetyltransferase [Robbsia sp. Bb-Pol-6]|uniref:GNAT family N-acetyltransferase n=1 Tax=Robbsia betulipollinis TaxID=2981849 RepID=A0ABT3ZQZ5_9BURK|nr:GNAT family N-acetyltransferase [Robbsia betulipollinis]MCY0388697.1 GNAT family N-acetyltransferase [Robbsia betulipollinis]
MRIAFEDPTQADVLTLLRHGEEESARLYPAESNHHVSAADLQSPDVLFQVARDPQGTALATGAVVIRGDWAELKRMWVEPPARCRGVSRAMLTSLMTAARARGVRWLRLETGVDSHAALTLYARAGFTVRAPFADYLPDPLSVFMERDLSA